MQARRHHAHTRRGRLRIRGRSTRRATGGPASSLLDQHRSSPTGRRPRTPARPPRSAAGNRSLRRRDADDGQREPRHHEVGEPRHGEYDGRQPEEKGCQPHAPHRTGAPADDAARMRPDRTLSPEGDAPLAQRRGALEPDPLERDITSASPRRPTCPSGTPPARRPLRRSTRPARWSSRAPATPSAVSSDTVPCRVTSRPLNKGLPESTTWPWIDDHHARCACWNSGVRSISPWARNTNFFTMPPYLKVGPDGERRRSSPASPHRCPTMDGTGPSRPADG